MEKPKFPDTKQEKTSLPHLELGESPNGLPAVEIHNPPRTVAATIRTILSANITSDPDYQARSTVGAFLQSGQSNDWILIEFWRGDEADHRAFVEYLNKRIVGES